MWVSTPNFTFAVAPVPSVFRTTNLPLHRIFLWKLENFAVPCLFGEELLFVSVDPFEVKETELSEEPSVAALPDVNEDMVKRFYEAN